ncbi:bifunctional folylpolyglutamate synthase/dihydrofolate synthase [Candidatus Woesearchaeota archaeon]|nr:bifunctional folylpolyglutamate synthase/dihydrofolate synthase [Candidatus Woesearchaeota archaeon]
MKNLDWLLSLVSAGTVLGLERMTALLEKLGNPHKEIKCIHVAGTNGKGSVCAMLSSILKEQGFKVGMYTSPHLKRFNERFQKDGKEIDEEELERHIATVRSVHTNQTFFEAATAIAFLYFQDVDFLVLEVGLGGRLDATNVITPLLSIITNISEEHTDYLGALLEQIAFEKAGIIKENVPVITAAKGKALKVIKEIARKKHAKIHTPHSYRNHNAHFSINAYEDLKLSLEGNFQLENAALAVQAVDMLKVTISEDAIRKGLGNTSWPGRFEFRNNILLDCTHNPGGALTLKKEIKTIRKRYEKVISVIGIMSDKDIESMVTIFSQFSDYIIFTQPKFHRASKPEDLAQYTSLPSEMINDVKKALKKAEKLAQPTDLIIVTGSIYTVGEI